MRFVSDLGVDILNWLQPREGERILDLGCGDGELTDRIAAAGATVVGIDASPELVAAARARGLDAYNGDGEALRFTAAFDAVFSNAALHWMTDAPAVVSGVHDALVPCGRFVAEFGGHGNVAAIMTALRAVAVRRGIDAAQLPRFYFPTSTAYRALLERQGFLVDRIELFHRPTPLPSGMIAWVRGFCTAFVAAGGDDAEAMLLDVEQLLAPSLQDEDGGWIADYVRLRVAARKE